LAATIPCPGAASRLLQLYRRTSARACIASKPGANVGQPSFARADRGPQHDGRGLRQA